MNEGKKAMKALDELAKIIVKSKPTIRSDYVVGWYRLWTRLPAIEKTLIKKGILTQNEIDAQQVPLLKKCRKDFK
ncbi:MAG: hypothetical protein HY363_03525 [Candidatus Aenigmarchaeota archaeon]|nr:hypothetical protein [Candidatus Aenigmarchaeota archaeon]